MKSLVNGADTEKACSAFLEFKDAVRASQVATVGPKATALPGDAIGKTTEKLSTASYPLPVPEERRLAFTHPPQATSRCVGAGVLESHRQGDLSAPWMGT